MSKNFVKKLRAESLEKRELLAADTAVSLPSTSPMDNLFDDIVVAASIDGTGNNTENPVWGTTDIQLLRIASVEYADGISSPAGEDFPSAREVSNSLSDQSESVLNERFLTDIVWLWGQFVDHDIDLTTGAEPSESFDIEVPSDDALFDPLGSGEVTIGLTRSIYDESTGDSADNPRQQLNTITAYLDGSVIYGSDAERTAELRTFDGGKLKTSEGDLLPFNEAGLDNAGGTSDSLFLAGDIRANENAALSAMQTVWVREHNRLAEEIAAADPSLTDEDIYQQARAIVMAELQAITYNEYLPALLGVDALEDFQEYDSSVNPGISNLFSTAAYRFGHSMLSSTLLRLDSNGTVANEGNLDLRDAFFAPQELIGNGIDSILLGAASQTAQEIDNMVIDDVRNFLFGPPGAGGFDLAALNIQRGRDHGLPDYNQARIDLGLEPVTSFDQITSDPELAAQLEATYGDVNSIDVWVGGLAEDHVPGSSMGELFRAVIADQFERIRAGDRLWYQNVLSGEELAAIENTKLSDVIARNTDLGQLRDNLFYNDSVFYFSASAGESLDGATLQVRGEILQLVENGSGRVLASQVAGATNKIVLMGSKFSKDRIIIDDSVLAMELSGGIVIDGQQGLHDEVILRGTHSADSFQVNDGWVDVNGIRMQMNGVETLRVLVNHRNDVVDIVDSGDMHVVVDTPMPTQRHTRHRASIGKRGIAPQHKPKVQTQDERRFENPKENMISPGKMDVVYDSTQVHKEREHNETARQKPAKMDLILEMNILDRVFAEMDLEGFRRRKR